jgi:hypothetical protein
MRSLVCPVLALALAGCAADPALTFGPAPDSDGGPIDTTVPLGGPTYYGQIDDVLRDHCWSCHSTAGGGTGNTVALDSYAAAMREGQQLVARVDAHSMPPFFARDDGRCGSFLHHGQALGTGDFGRDWVRGVLRRWVERGMLEGDPSEAATPVALAHIPDGEVTETIAMTRSYLMSPDGAGDDVRCFVIDRAVATDRQLLSFEVIAGNPTLVHDVIVYAPLTDADATSATALEAADASDPRPGYPCFGGPGVPASPVAIWTPGSARVDYPAGTGLTLPANRALVMRVHYSSAYSHGVDAGVDPFDGGVDGGRVRAERIDPGTRVRFVTQSTMPNPARMVEISQTSLSLPAGRAMVSSDAVTGSLAGLTVYAVFPQMQHLGASMSIQRGTSCVLQIDGWSASWPRLYTFGDEQAGTAVPLAPSTDDVSITCTYDTNAAMNDPTTFGEGADHELCRAYFYVTGP